MADIKGNIKFAGANFYITGEDGFTYRYDGTAEGSPKANAIPGSFWVDHTNSKFYYIDENKYKRYIPLKSVGVKASAIIGSVWVEANRWKWIGANNTAYIGHADYTDYGYSDSGYYDSGYNDSDVHLDNGGYVDNYQYRDAGYSDYSDYRYGDSIQNPVKIN